jgi:small GTP-binding protein
MTDAELLEIIARAEREGWTELDLSGNDLEVLPPEIGRLRSLEKLILGKWDDDEEGEKGNRLTAIPQEIFQLINLKELHISFNEITAIPDAIAQLANLTRLDLRANPLPILPEILEDYNNPAAIIAYWQKLKQGKRKLNEAKVILVGHGAVGKTSLVRQLIDRDFKPDENKTEGIDIRHWTVTAREENVRLRVWDFGGQEIMHATHQFFLTERSLYLLVLNARKDEGNNDVEYWLKIIESFGKDAPVLVIANKSDEHPLKLNRRHLQEKYPNIQAFFETSCKKGTGIDELRTEIAQQISAMDHVFDVLPQQWFRLKEQIEKIDRDHISYLEYEQLCATEEISDKQERSQLIRLLHLLGIVLNFADDTRLQDTNVLNPEWVTGGVYRILNDNLLSTKHKGMLTSQELDRILKPKTKDDRDCYRNNRDRQFILDMMQKFELCFPLDTSSRNPIYLIPELLDEEEPDTGLWENTLNFEYYYPTIFFSSIISRFIVKMHHCISKHTYWRTGVILANKEGNRAFVKADITDRKVFIRIDGNERTRRAFLSAIRNTFDSIHDSISALEVDEQVPLPDNPKETVSYEHLLSLEKRGKTDYSDSDRDYNIRELLDGIEDRRDRKQKDDLRDNFRGDRYSSPMVKVNISNNNQQQTTVMTEPEKPQLKNHSKTKEIKLPPVVVASMAFVLLFLTTAALVLTFAGILNITSFIIAMFSIVLLIVIGVSFILKVTGQIEGQSFEKIILAVLKQLTLYDAFLGKIGDILGKSKDK